jgi:threonylcarbamoyladenosine tRNA methylthiotransferase MtaB
MQSRQAIRKAIRDNPDARIVVTGCYAQTAPHEIDNIDGVDDVVGHDKKMTISGMIDSLGGAGSSSGPIPDEPAQNAPPAQPIADPADASRTRPFLKIQDGCDAFCTYCIVPYARGRSRSMPVTDVLRGIDQLAAAGYHEVVLTGIHLGAYGRDLLPPAALPTLLHQIQDLIAIDRVRLSSIEPLELTTEIIETVADSEIFCHHFHIPLQSGDDDILKNMGRPYSRQIFRELVRKIHERLPDAAIGADILIGFPGESDSAFRNTFELITELPLSYLHVFPYSARPGTPAADLPDQIPQEIIRDRCDQMRRLGQKKRRHFYQKFVGKKVLVLIESKRDRQSGQLKGVSSNYLPVRVEGDDSLKNKLVDVEVQKLEKNSLIGNLSARKNYSVST